MVKLALLFLLLPLVQEDPQVIYREGLFEEVDQGNLEKAAELYAKVLKSNAPDALKAKALFRTGACHEKKGRKDEAERAWRDVIERFPGAEAAKLARERLESQSRPGAGSPQSMESTIQSTILDLGNSDHRQRAEAIRKLGLIADPAVSYLRNALQHKDGRLAVGAARVLIQLELKEGLYEPLIAAFGRYYDVTDEDAGALGTLLGERKELRDQFLKDHEKFAASPVIGKIHWVFDASTHPEFPKLLENWLVNPKVYLGDPQGTWSYACSHWSKGATEADLVRLVERLTTSDPPQYARLLLMFNRSLDLREPLGKGLQSAVLAALTRHQKPQEIIGEISRHWWMRDRLNPSQLIQGPVAAWFGRGTPALKRTIIDSGANMVRSDLKELSDEFRKFLFARLGDKSESWEIRVEIDGKVLTPGTPEETSHAVSFGLDLLRQNGNGPERPGTRTALYNLMARIPADSKDLPYVLDTAFDRLGDKDAIDARLQKSSRAAVVAAALRAVKRKANAMELALVMIATLGTPLEKVELAGLLPAIPADRSQGYAVQAYASGLKELPDAARDEAWKGFRKLFDESRPDLQSNLAFEIKGWNPPGMDELMKEATRSEHQQVRYAAIHYWRTNEKGEGIPLLIRALEDKSVGNVHAAITFLGELRALDAVPSLIRFLEGSPGGLRDHASASLQLIRKHYEERVEWQRWYDETKKTLNK